MTALFFDDAIEGVHAGDVYTAAMWVTFEHGTIGEWMIGIVGSDMLANDARRAVDDVFNVGTGLDFVDRSL